MPRHLHGIVDVHSDHPAEAVYLGLLGVTEREEGGDVFVSVAKTAPRGRMRFDEAREHIGEAVAYHPAGSEPEHGTIAAASTVYVFVQYPGERGTRATYPEDLTLIAGDR